MYCTTTASTLMVGMPLLAASASGRFQKLWKAREAGPAKLDKALNTCYSSELPKFRKDILLYCASGGADLKNKKPGTSYRYDKEAVINYQRMGISPPIATIEAISLFRRGLSAMSVISGLTAASIFYMTALDADENRQNIINVLIAGSVTNLACYLLYAKGFVWSKSITLNNWFEERKDAELELAAAAVAASSFDRDKERHFLALASANLFLTSTRSNQGEVAIRARGQLAALAQERGSHYAAHYLWLLREEGVTYGVSDLSRWRFDDDPKLFDRFLQGDAAAKDVVNLAIRESASFRRSFITAMEGKNLDGPMLTLAKKIAA